MLTFPKGFFWGAATSSHQVEGNNTNNDWWEAETKGSIKTPSLQACRSYELFREDFDIAKSLNHNSHRFSIEWSRVEPEEGKFSESEIAHYRQVISSLKECGIEPIVTLHHFTNPLWFSAKGGWLKPGNIKYFTRFTERIAGEFAGEVRFWATINEPNIYAHHCYLIAAWPPHKSSLWQALIVKDNLIKAHIQAYRAIHRIYQEKKLTTPMVSIAHNVQCFEICRPTLRNKLARYIRDRLYNFYFLNKLFAAKSLDYIGLNYYNRGLIDVLGWTPYNLVADVCRENHFPLKKNSLGWDIYPEGLYKLLVRLYKKFKLPLFILENGICTSDDNLRWEYISGHLEAVHRAISEGAEILGYTYWSLLDNFEWAEGFTPRFGLVEVDYKSFKRTVRESARKFSEVAKTNILC